MSAALGAARILNSLLKKAFGLKLQLHTAASSPDLRLQKLIADRQVSLVLDVGANVGQFGRELRRAGYRGTILSFEPLSHAHAALVKAAQSDSNWHVAPRAAIGAAASRATINVAGNSVSSSLLPMLPRHLEAAPTSASHACEDVDVLPLDTFYDDYATDHSRVLLKIDTQGFEQQVISGAGRWLDVAEAIHLELSLVPLYSGQALLAEIAAELEARGFNLFALDPIFSDSKTGQMYQVDGTFVRADRDE